jgi:hypothetical protein
MITHFASKVAVTLAASGLAVAGAIGPAQAADTSGWQVAATIAPNDEEVQLNAVTAIAPNDAWAVGPTGTTTGNIVEQWNGADWQQVAVPAGTMAQVTALSSVSATSDSNVWAFDFFGDWLRFDGSSWTAGQVPALPGGENGVGIATGIAVGPHDAWQFGFDSTSAGLVSYAARFNGSTWKAMSLPGPSGEFGVSDASAVSPEDIWAVVGGGPSQTTANGLLHWDGQRWSTVTLPSFLAQDTDLASVLALPDGDVWVAGSVIPDSTGQAQGVTALWNGRTWTVDELAVDPNAPDDVISDLVPDGSGGIWAMGFTGSECAGPMWHYSAGTWADTGLVGCSVGAFVHGPQGLASVPGTTSVWAVGGQNDPNVPNNEAGLVLLYGPEP